MMCIIKRLGIMRQAQRMAFERNNNMLEVFDERNKFCIDLDNASIDNDESHEIVTDVHQNIQVYIPFDQESICDDINEDEEEIVLTFSQLTQTQSYQQSLPCDGMRTKSCALFDNLQ
ncbi:Hypothetical_protein [Hexamita inflata]|uniref:Hypothetical_protein n=1 Tax=Hexamita inflata TaxID=28002 RepID=A0AA86P3V6_9EUKA|nr:Hypothetical protein HINF_LOCUS17589 [Hexamita inflata]